MTENPEDKPKKLTLGSSKLSLNKNLGQPSIVNKIVLSTKSNTVIEVKNNKAATGLSLDKNQGFADSQKDILSASEEFNKRLNILRKAAQDAKSKDSDPKISTLSKLAAINQVELPEKQESAPNDGVVTPDIEVQIPTLDHKVTGNKSVAKHHDNSFDDEEDLLDKKKLHDTKVIPKPKLEETKKLNKADIFQMLDPEDGDTKVKTRSLASIRRAREKERRKSQEVQKQEKVYREVIVPEVISVGELANRMTERVADVIRELMKLGIIATTHQTVDADVAELIVTTFGHTAKRVNESDVENVLIEEIDSDHDLLPRAPIVTVMGHVDHGKTSLLDALKSTDIALNESGGITQHIGAYKVMLADGRSITFIDTPGHEAFTQMRTRGAKVTDVVVLVVAADDGIKPQTIEAISHAKAANVPIIVAINKIDKPDVNLERIKQELVMHELISEELGGDTIIVPVSALKRMNLDQLEESILLVAEMQNLRSNPNAVASGVVIEARIDRAQGIVAVVLVQRGTLRVGDIVVVGQVYGKVKKMNNDKGFAVKEAGPSEPVEIYGLNEVPQAGDRMNVTQSEKYARDIAEYRERKARDHKVSITQRDSVENLFLRAADDSNIKDFPLIIKGDVHGSVEAIISSLLKLPNDEVKLKVLHSGVGGVTESDINLAKASNAIILGFNVRANNNASDLANRNKVDIRYYSIIYDLIDDIKLVMSGMLSPIVREQYIGSADIRQIFDITKVGKIAGSYITKGMIKRGAGVRLLRDNVVIHEGKLKTLKRFKEDVKEVREGYECGIAFEHYDNLQVGDTLEVFELIEERKVL